MLYQIIFLLHIIWHVFFFGWILRASPVLRECRLATLPRPKVSYVHTPTPSQCIILKHTVQLASALQQLRNILPSSQVPGQRRSGGEEAEKERSLKQPAGKELFFFHPWSTHCLQSLPRTHPPNQASTRYGKLERKADWTWRKRGEGGGGVLLYSRWRQDGQVDDFVGICGYKIIKCWISQID